MIISKNSRVLLIASALGLSSLALASGAPKADQGGDAKKAESAGGGDEKAKKEPAKSEDVDPSIAAEKVKADNRKAYTVTNNYVHTWTKFPPITGKAFIPNANKSFQSQKDQIEIVFFVSSWCLPCQKVFPRILEMQERYSKFNTSFVYIFANDTEVDARNFAKEYKMTKNAFLADHAIKKSFHNPPLPSVYISDRRGWLNHRILRMDEVGAAQLDKYLMLATAY